MLLGLKFKNYVHDTPYQGGGNSTEPPSSLKLDPIDVARSLHKKRLPRNLFPWLAAALDLIEQPNVFAKLFTEEPAIDWTRMTSAEYSQHIDALLDMKPPVIERVDRSKVRFLSRYFAVAKKDNTARAIWNGRLLSRKQNPPEPVNLPEIPEVLRAASEVQHDFQYRHPGRAPEPSISSTDFRHWFHQIEVSPEISCYFAIGCDGRFYVWRGLPMGWSHSPRIAQCIAWAIVLSLDLDCLAEECDMAKRSEHPPAYVFTRDRDGLRTGIIFVWYDNIVAIIWDPLHFRNFIGAFNNRCNVVNAAISEMRQWKSGGWKRTDELPAFLGVEVTTRLHRDREGRSLYPLSWRPSDSYRRKVTTSLERFQAGKDCDLSRRDVVTVVGLVVWNAYLRDVPLYTESATLEIARSNGRPQSSGKIVWDAPSSLCDSDRDTLILRLQHCANLEWSCAVPPSSDRPSFILVSDSSDHYGAYVVFDRNGEILDTRSWKWDSHASSAHIFLKELMAATIAVEAQSSATTSVHLLCDNTAAVHVVRRGFSSSCQANGLIERMFSALPRSAIRITSIKSEDNAADPLTRSAALCPSRCLRSLEAARAAAAGWPKTEVKAPFMDHCGRECLHDDAFWFRHDDACSGAEEFYATDDVAGTDASF